jgi:hypothetical protein
MSILTKLLGDLQKGKPVAPPAAPPPLQMESHPFELPVPYALEEMPRTFLHLLKVSPDIPPQIRGAIEVWLQEYDERMLAFLHQKYGQGVDQLADAITRQVMNQMHAHVDNQARAVERDVLDDLEKQLREEGVEGDGEARSDGTA